MNKLKIAVIFGSRSTEHDISIITAISSIIKPLLLSDQYEVVPVYISKDGKWYSSNKFINIELYSSGKIASFLASLKPIYLELNSGFKLVYPGIKNKVISIDCVFPATHGTHGEDGELMAILQMANVAFVGCNMQASVLSMDKALTKTLAKSANIPVSNFVWFHSYEYRANAQKILDQVKLLRYPLFVKPVHLGSSIAISRVKNSKELVKAIELAMFYDNKVIIEEAVNNLIELTLPIIGNLDQLTPALLERPQLKNLDFFDFETKYMSGGKKGKGATGSQGSANNNYSQLPAKVDKEIAKQAITIATDVYKLLGCSGISRIDLLVDELTKKVYFNEINPLPGDLYKHNWQANGISPKELVDRLIKLALENFKVQSELQSSFSSNYLSQFKS